MFESEVFREQMYCIGESTCEIDGAFRTPPSVIRHPRHCASLPSLSTPLQYTQVTFAEFLPSVA